MIKCNNILLSWIRQVFKEKEGRNGTKVIGGFHLKMPPMDTNIPVNLLADHKAGQIDLDCQLMNDGSHQRISINSEAFSSSRVFASVLKISSCDILGLTFAFLRGFKKLHTISFHSITNVHLAHWITLSSLPSLATFRIKNSRGLDKWNAFPHPIYRLESIDIGMNEMGDEAIDRILQWIVDSPSVNTLKSLNLELNVLTQIPHQLPSFKKLERIYLRNNLFNQTILSGSLNFSYPVKHVSLASCGISNIQPGAFQGFLTFNNIIFPPFKSKSLYHNTLGDFSNAFIDLKNNSLTQLDSFVFVEILNQMDPKNKCGLHVSQSITGCFLL